MAYTRTTWTDYPDTSTPITATRLNNIEAFLAGMSTIQDAWTTYTPAVDQAGAVTISTNNSKYKQYGKTVHAIIYLTLSSTGTAGTAFTVSLPVVTAVGNNGVIGAGAFYDTSTTTRYMAAANVASSTTVNLIGDWSGTGAWGSTPNLAVGSGDSIRMTLTYEAA